MKHRRYLERILKWRAEREASISAPYGWLSTAGLFWLRQGENRIGSKSNDSVQLPLETGSAAVGSFFLEGEAVKLVSFAGSEIFMDDNRIVETQIRFEDDSSPEIRIGDLKLFVIRRGTRYGIRIFNPQNPARLSFSRLNWFPVSDDYIFCADFRPFNEMMKVQTMNILGDPVEMDSPGLLEFSINGKTCQLQPVLAEDDRFWILFRDKTNGSETYAGGRFLMSDRPTGGKTSVDFNTAYNPPCAYTHFATCPVPLPGNRIEFPITAGEKKYFP